MHIHEAVKEALKEEKWTISQSYTVEKKKEGDT